MTTPIAERIFLDTNVLLAASDESRREHMQAREALTGWPAAGTVLYLSGQVIREYLAVATRPVRLNGLGMTQTEAVRNARVFRARSSVLVEDAGVNDQLLALLDSVSCTGKNVHDANLVATMLAHGIDTLLTSNIDDFARYGDVVTVVSLRSHAKGQDGN